MSSEDLSTNNTGAMPTPPPCPPSEFGRDPLQSDPPNWMSKHPDVRFEEIDERIEFAFIKGCENCQVSLHLCQCGQPKVSERLIYNRDIGVNEPLIETLRKRAAAVSAKTETKAEPATAPAQAAMPAPEVAPEAVKAMAPPPPAFATPSKSKSGDEVFVRFVVDDLETFVAATVLDGRNPMYVRIKYAIPLADEIEEDLIPEADLRFVEPAEEPATMAGTSAPVAVHTLTVEESIARHLTLLFEPGDRICITLIHNTKLNSKGTAALVLDHFMSLEEAITPQKIKWMQQMNDEGFNVYSIMNALIPGADKRPKEYTKSEYCRSVFAEVDEGGPQVYNDVLNAAKAGEVPAPSIILQSSPNKFQFIWRVAGADLTVNKIESMNEAIVRRFGCDPVCTNVLRLFRIPGLRNMKVEYAEKPLVNVIDVNAERRYNFAEFKLSISEKNVAPAKPAANEEELIKVRDYFEAAATEVDAKIDIEPTDEDGTPRQKLNISGLQKWGNSGYLWEMNCFWRHLHKKNIDTHTTVVILHKSGALSLTCHHGHCVERTWQKDMRPKMEEIVGHPLPFGDAKPEWPILICGKTSEESLPAVEARKAEKTKVKEERAQAIAAVSIVSDPEEDGPNIDELEKAGLPIVDYPDPGDDDYISLFAKDLISGTNIPLAYVREPLKYMVNHLLDGYYFHPAYPRLSLRGNHFSIGESESAKTMGFDLAKAWMEPQFKERGFVMRKLLSYKSEALLVKSLSSEADKQGRKGNPSQFLYITEGAELSAKKNNDCFQEVFAKIMDLYDQTEADTGSFTNGSWHATDVKVSTFICFTHSCFRDTYGSKGSIGSGGLGRFTICCPRFVFQKEDWKQMSGGDLEKSFRFIKSRLPGYGTTGALLEESPEAKDIRLDAKEFFFKAGKLGKRILEGFVKEQVNRAVMSKDHPNIMTGPDAERIYAWAKSVTEARGKCWPPDAGNNVEQMELTIRRLVFTRKHRVSEAILKDACNYYRAGSGGAWAFHSALANLKKSDIKWTGLTRKGTALYCPKACQKHMNLDDLSKPELKVLLKSVA